MSRAVYSARFVAGLLSSGTTEITYTVPGGMVAVIKDVVSVNATGGTSTGFWGISGLTVNGEFTLATPANSYHWSGSQVANAGETFRVVWSTGSFYAAISGYLLTVS